MAEFFLLLIVFVVAATGVIGVNMKDDKRKTK